MSTQDDNNRLIEIQQEYALKALEESNLYPQMGKKMSPQQACKKITENSNEPSLNYAVNYALFGMHMVDGEELRVQCLYILNNISRWRGDLAKEVRATLKAYAIKNCIHPRNSKKGPRL